jgi:hypothetical protein
MKPVAGILILLFVIAIMPSVAVSGHRSCENSGPILMALDVCHAGGAALSLDADTQTLVDTRREVLYVASVGTPILVLASDMSELKSYVKHQPPKAA